MNPLQMLGWCRQLSWGFAMMISVLIASAQQPSPDELQRVLRQMDQTAADFRTTQAAFVWDQYQKVVDEHDLQKGKVYFRRSGNGIEMAAEITNREAPKS